MATLPNVALLLVLHLLLTEKITAATWCVARNDAKEDALQRALDYACGAGADCTPLQDAGLCFLPNTIQAHASYAFNSYFMHASMDSGSCDFSGTSYGSCVYPSSPSSYGQNLDTSIYIGETLFCCAICIGGLILFAQLIGNMQTYLQSMTVRLEEWRIKKRDTEEWMRHRQLPPISI